MTFTPEERERILAALPRWAQYALAAEPKQARKTARALVNALSPGLWKAPREGKPLPEKTESDRRKALVRAIVLKIANGKSDKRAAFYLALDMLSIDRTDKRLEHSLWRNVERARDPHIRDLAESGAIRAEAAKILAAF